MDLWVKSACEDTRSDRLRAPVQTAGTWRVTKMKSRLFDSQSETKGNRGIRGKMGEALEEDVHSW